MNNQRKQHGYAFLKFMALLALVGNGMVASSSAALKPTTLRTEYLSNPLGLDSSQPRLQWQLASNDRGAKQTAYRILVAGSAQQLTRNEGDLWDSGKVASNANAQITYAGKPLTSGQPCFWKVQVWDENGKASRWSENAHWTMGLLTPRDWKAEWISYRDNAPLHTNRTSLFLPPARHYRKEFTTTKSVKRATLYASALGLVDMHLNGQPITDSFFESGWADYEKRAYYRTHDVTSLLQSGDNFIGAVVADGWYAGYVGYGLLVGYGPNRVGRYFYGKTPAFLAQLEIEYTDGSRETIITDNSWQVSSDGPFREADMIMGEAFEAQRHDANWCVPKSSPRHARGPSPEWKWESAIRAGDNGSTKAVFSDNRGSREVESGFQRPPKLQAYAAQPIRITQELKTQRITEPKPGVYIFDLGQNFAGIIRLRVKGPAGTRLQIRYGEMLHPDGRLMTENLRKARATDFYTLSGDRDGEIWSPRFTYHGFQFVEVSGLPARPSLDTVTGLVLHNDTPLAGELACSDEVMTKFWKNTQWTQRANFIEMPTDCPQRDERLGWMGDAQVYVRTASYNADVAAFFTKWLDDLVEAQREFGPYPDYCPYPMGHGAKDQTWGTAWTDAGIICPYTIWQVYGDKRLIEKNWDSMTRFMNWRKQRAKDFRGGKDGNTWGDWLNVNEPTPIEFVDAAYFKHDADLMFQMARALGKQKETDEYVALSANIATQFAKDYQNPDGTLKVNTQTAHVLALTFKLLPGASSIGISEDLAERIAKNDFRMATGFLGTKPLLPALSASGQNDLACRLFQSRRFPSWGYEVVNGATSVWERWDSYTKEFGFNGADGKQNASMNSFSHYSFGAVMEWGFRTLAGIDTDGPGFKQIIIRPNPPTPGSNPEQTPIDWVKAHYDSINGRIVSSWRRTPSRFELEATIPANTAATVFLPAADAAQISESGKALTKAKGVDLVRFEGDHAVLRVGAGTYKFASTTK
ncbi:MAG: family 78 glycoside hydrolase catalytic domain [Verrucomicrobia bacterium]|nr:family 78 glycoside hydrolase catalytic domain [Verrucomicrobiota bacterium]